MVLSARAAGKTRVVQATFPDGPSRHGTSSQTDSSPEQKDSQLQGPFLLILNEAHSEMNDHSEEPHTEQRSQTEAAGSVKVREEERKTTPWSKAGPTGQRPSHQ
ncbi:hypothetical protein INR49_019724 [Caranx melampygus]|nr:hypothetical protein INR49_019724 [Caranx melampygus]